MIGVKRYSYKQNKNIKNMSMIPLDLNMILSLQF